ncbi:MULTISPECIES: hypothetical protein [Staphylococcus]|uniref:hypothetical protein n=1 Tax=Staphylococcus TaxID=1279 RepID=UPI000AB5370B|nr:MULTISPECIES: hypothetical protein [Staphylococcus]
MENADLAIGAKKVLIFATNFPISTPYKLEDAIKELEESGAKIKLITPSKAVFDKLNELSGNTVDPSIRPDIFKARETQALEDVEIIRNFWNE